MLILKIADGNNYFEVFQNSRVTASYLPNPNWNRMNLSVAVTTFCPKNGVRPNRCANLVPMHRRDFLQFASMASACAAAPIDVPKYRIVSRFTPSPKPGMPGPFLGKAVRVHSEKSVDTSTHKIDA